VRLVFLQQFRANSMPPVRFRYIKSDDVGERRIFFAQNETGNLRAVRGDQALRARLRKKVPQHGFGIRNTRRKTRLIQFVERSKIVRLVLSNRHSHAADSMDREGFCRRIFTADTEDSAMLAMLVIQGPFCLFYFSGGACANRNFPHGKSASPYLFPELISISI